MGNDKPMSMYDDSIIGWYRMEDSSEKSASSSIDTLVPILKRGNEFYTICRGFEMPLKTSPVGLEWAFNPSSMEGTVFIFCRPAWPCALKLYDAQKVVFDWYEPGKKYKLVKVDQPYGLFEEKAEKPEDTAGYLGVYQPLYFPWYRIEIKQDDTEYYYIYSELRIEQGIGRWIPMSNKMPAKALDNNKGFLIVQGEARNYLMYNELLERYEMVVGSTKLRMPAVKVSSKDDFSEIPKVSLGIPSWN